MLRAGRYTAAILMVAVGVGLIVDLATGSSYLTDWIKYWPILLIMLGAEYLIMNLFTAGGQKQLRLDIGALVLSFLISGAVVLLVQGKSVLADWNIELSPDGIEQFIETVGEGPHRLGKPIVKPVQYAEWKDGLDTIAVSNPNGKVTLVAGEVDQIEVETTVYVARGTGKRADSIAERSVVRFENKGDTLNIEAEGERYSLLFMRLRPRMDLHITVPAHLQADFELYLKNGTVTADGVQTKDFLRAETKNGSIAITNVAGNAELKSMNGRIAVSQLDGHLKLKTKNGRIEVSDIFGDAELATSNGTMIARNIYGTLRGETSNGRIELGTVKGPVHVVTKNGNIEIEELSNEVTARTSNGDIQVLSSVIGGDWNLKTGNGNINLRVPEEGHFKVEARSAKDLSTDLGLQVRSRRMTGSVGDGTYTLQLDADGKIEVLALK